MFIFTLSFTATIAPIALPTGSEANEDFAGETAVASGFGLTESQIGKYNTQLQYKRYFHISYFIQKKKHSIYCKNKNNVFMKNISNLFNKFSGGPLPPNQVLSHASLSIISNSVCSFAFPLILQDSNICTSGLGGSGTCQGDSGGPLAVTRANGPVLVRFHVEYFLCNCLCEKVNSFSSVTDRPRTIVF